MVLRVVSCAPYRDCFPSAHSSLPFTDQTAVGIDPNDLAALTVQNELKAAWLALCPADAARITIVPSIQDAMAAVRSGTEGTEKNTHTLVTGSLLLVGGVMSHLRDEGALDDALLSVRSQG